MSGVGDWAETNLLTWLLDDVASPTRPTAWYVSYHTGAPGNDGTANVSAVGGYARQEVHFGPAAAGVIASDGTVAAADGNPVTLTPSSGSETITHICIFDAVSGGNCLFVGELAVARAIDSSNPLVLNAGDIVCTLA